jgi:L-alanine-DL-glutamate epimerase-like enolase superfamily enzyme
VKQTDIRITAIRTAFTEEKFRTPLVLSTGAIETITYAEIRIDAENRAGETAQGAGGVLLSDLWAFPSPAVDHAAKDRAMRVLVQLWAEALQADGGFADPFEHAHRMEAQMDELLREARRRCGLQTDIPRLAGLVAMSPLDAAVHDAWSKAAGRSAYEMYTRDYLNRDLGDYLGEAFRGCFPGDFLRHPAGKLWLQHVVGGSDPLADDGGSQAPRDGLPVSLADWIRRDRVRWFKLKIKGDDVASDLERIQEVYRIAAETAAACGIREPVLYELDPNEGFRHPDPAVELLRKLRERSPEAFAALQYMEQPTPRRLAEYERSLHELAALKPVLADESLDDLAQLPELVRLGFNGAALKTCKGHSHALLMYCWARKLGLRVAVQDLTNPGGALMHSAGLAARLHLTWDCFEANSRQYLPFSRLNDSIAHLFPGGRGQIDLSGLKGPGIYSSIGG